MDMKKTPVAATARCPRNHTVVRLSYAEYAAMARSCNGDVWCSEHRRQVNWVAITGRITEKPCGGACKTAKSPDCECQCGGERHGELAA